MKIAALVASFLLAFPLMAQQQMAHVLSAEKSQVESQRHGDSGGKSNLLILTDSQ